MQQNTHGSVFDTITRSTFDSIQVAVPPYQLTQAFDRSVALMMEHILTNLLQITTLTAIRDSLLPKLMSGEVRVRDAEKIVEAAV